jgi:hypothetical protein
MSGDQGDAERREREERERNEPEREEAERRSKIQSQLIGTGEAPEEKL